jgi:hypothetical protein
LSLRVAAAAEMVTPDAVVAVRVDSVLEPL